MSLETDIAQAVSAKITATALAATPPRTFAVHVFGVELDATAEREWRGWPCVTLVWHPAVQRTPRSCHWLVDCTAWVESSYADDPKGLDVVALYGIARAAVQTNTLNLTGYGLDWMRVEEKGESTIEEDAKGTKFWRVALPVSLAVQVTA